MVSIQILCKDGFVVEIFNDSSTLILLLGNYFIIVKYLKLSNGHLLKINFWLRWLGRVVGGTPEVSVLLPASASGITLVVRACDASQVSMC